MERARATWTDERLDDLSRSVGRVDEDVRQLRTEMNARLDSFEGRLGIRIDGVQARLESRIDGVEAGLGARIDGLQRTMMQVGGGVIVAVVAALANLFLTGSG